MPPISITEQEALEAGDTWIESSIYRGTPDFELLQKTWVPKLSEKEQAFIDGPVKTLISMIDDDVIQKSNHVSDEILTFLKENSFFSMIIPEAFGGLEFTPYANSTIIAMISSKSSAVATTVCVPNSLGPSELLMHYGTKEEQNHWLPRLADGRDIPCFALTSPEAGSDAGSIPDKGIVTYGEHNGEKVLGLMLTWDKRYITLAPIATVLGLAFKAFDPDGLLGDKRELGITCALIPKSHSGVEIGNRHDPMGTGFYNGTTRGKDVFIPMSFIIGGEKNIGRGWSMLIECLLLGRGVALPAMGTSSAQGALLSTSAYSVVREQFNLPIGKFEGVQDKLSDIAGKTFIVEAMRKLTTAALTEGRKPAVVTAMAKYHMTELGRDVLTQAMDVQAGKAIQKGPQNTLANAYTAQPIGITVEGANVLTRNLMIFGQGAMRCHPYLQELVELIYSEEKGANAKFYKALIKTVGFSVKNALRSLRYSYLPLGISDINNSLFENYSLEIKKLSAKLAPLADLSLLVLGGDLKRKEMLSARLGDVMSYLYMAMACLRYYQQAENQVEAEPYLHYAMAHLLDEAEQSLYDFIGNFPSKPVRGLMRVMTGNVFAKRRSLDDRLRQNLAEASIQDSSMRKALTSLIMVEENDGNDINEKAYKAKLAAMPLLKKVKAESKSIDRVSEMRFGEIVEVLLDRSTLTTNEAEQLLTYNELRKRAIRVDEYDFEMNLLDL